MSNDNFTFLSPVGRLVQGSPFEGQDKNMKGQPLTDRNGKPRVDFFARIAFPKADPDTQKLISSLMAIAQACYPGRQIPPHFAYKVIDGDTQVDSQGVPYSQREGFAGCYVIKFGSGYAPKVYTSGGAAVLTGAPGDLKRGDFIRVYGSIAPNNDTEKPGVYWNYNMVERIAFGVEIATGPSGAAVFGAAPVTALPPGASLTPTAPPVGLAQPAAPGFGQPAAPGFAAPTAPAGPGAGPAGFPGVTPAASGPGFAAPPVVPASGPGFAAPPVTPAPAAIPVPPHHVHPTDPSFVCVDGQNWVKRETVPGIPPLTAQAPAAYLGR